MAKFLCKHNFELLKSCLIPCKKVNTKNGNWPLFREIWKYTNKIYLDFESQPFFNSFHLFNNIVTADRKRVFMFFFSSCNISHWVKIFLSGEIIRCIITIDVPFYIPFLLQYFMVSALEVLEVFGSCWLEKCAKSQHFGHFINKIMAPNYVACVDHIDMSTYQNWTAAVLTFFLLLLLRLLLLLLLLIITIFS